ncbi:MAG TPA: hypothetical protein VHC69_25420 [Polyangiaceae bacterium]|nr:hypothetical protein [Polyangiaceae bacterium]
MTDGTDDGRSNGAALGDPEGSTPVSSHRRRRRRRRRRSHVSPLLVAAVTFITFSAACIAAYYFGQASDEPTGTGVHGWDE